MGADTEITGRLVAAARNLIGVNVNVFARAAGLPVDLVNRIEASGSARVNSEQQAIALHRACEHFGVVVLDERDGMGAGVRLKFTRQDVKQILRLEGEGGIVASDGNP